MRNKILFIGIVSAAIAGAFFHIHMRPYEPILSSTKAPPRGAYHLHTTASHDGHTEPKKLRQAASKLGLQFLVVTDHNTTANVQGHSNLTVLNYPELSTPFGHVIGFGLKSALPKTLRDTPIVLKEIKSRGGKPILAHPTRRRNPWQGSWESVGGIEIHNIADQLQDSPIQALNILATLPANSLLAKALLFKRDDKALSRWDDFSDPQVIGICANDSHGRLSLHEELNLWFLELETTWPEDPRERELKAIHALATGRFHCTSSIIEHGGGFQFSAQLNNTEKLASGQSISQTQIEALEVSAPHLQTDRASIVLYRNGTSIALSYKPNFRYPRPSPGTYRVEIHVPIPHPFVGQESIPVIYSNKIRVLD